MLSQRSTKRRERCCSSTTTTIRSAPSSWLTSTLVPAARVKQNTLTTTMTGAAQAKSSPLKRKSRTRRRRSLWRKSGRSSSGSEAYSLTKCWRHRRSPSDYNPKSHSLCFKVSKQCFPFLSSFRPSTAQSFFFGPLQSENFLRTFFAK